jgi:hypothetical protein
VSLNAPARRSPSLYAAAIAVVFLALHLPFLPASLEDLDSINFALGLHRFDVAHHQPHPPGYPVFTALGRFAHLFVASDARALSLVSIVAGTLGVLAIAAFFRELDRHRSSVWPLAATVTAVGAPLYWFTAARPLSDMTGLAAAVGIQALTMRGGLAVAACLAGAATGVRSQVAWLTMPLLLLAITWKPQRERIVAAATCTITFLAGVLVWAVPLVWLSGGPRAYWAALFNQGAEDLAGIQMLWTTPTPRVFVSALYYAFVAPWAEWQIATLVLAAAAVGVVATYRRARESLVVLAAAFVPYLVFDLLFQETFTTRYALPLVVPVAYLAVSGLGTFRPAPAVTLVLAVASVNITTTMMALSGYARSAAPAFRMLADMATSSNTTPYGSPLPPVVAMHRREELDLRRPLAWLGNSRPAFAAHLAAPPKHEWLELVKYWNDGGRDAVWFVADPRRSDLALVDHAPPRSYRWAARLALLLGGVRPSEMAWYSLDRPGWYLGEGWALTPETAGVAAEDHRGPAVAPIAGWIRRRSEAADVMVGGRNMTTAPATMRLIIDGRTLDEPAIAPGFFLRVIRIPAGGLAGNGDYAPLSISAPSDGVAIEQFDAQSEGVVMAGYGEGWHEHEYDPSTGRLWRWTSDRAILRVRSARRNLRLAIAGDAGPFWRASHVTIRIGDRIVAEDDARSRFSLSVAIPAALIGASETAIAVETNQTYVPAERSRRSQDRRHLGLRVYECAVTPIS